MAESDSVIITNSSVKIVSPGSSSYLDHNYSAKSASQTQQFQNTSVVEMSGNDSDDTPYLDAFFQMNTSENFNKMLQEIASFEEKRLVDSEAKCQELKLTLNKARYGLIRRIIHNVDVAKKHKNNPAIKQLLSDAMTKECKEVGEQSAAVEKELKVVMEVDKQNKALSTKRILDACQQNGVFQAEQPDDKLPGACYYYSMYKLGKILHPEEDLKEIQLEINGLRSRRQSRNSK